MSERLRDPLTLLLTAATILLGGGTVGGFGLAREEAGMAEVLRDALSGQGLLAQGAYEHGFEAGLENCP